MGCTDETREGGLRLDIRAAALEAEPIDPLLREIDAALADDADALLRNADGDIDGALQRIHDPYFGICMDCGDDIGIQRLMAFPTAVRCIACQSHHERANS
jgi:RNA polymerase-binding transcription factor DksA